MSGARVATAAKKTRGQIKVQTQYHGIVHTSSKLLDTLQRVRSKYSYDRPFGRRRRKVPSLIIHSYALNWVPVRIYLQTSLFVDVSEFDLADCVTRESDHSFVIIEGAAEQG